VSIRRRQWTVLAAVAVAAAVLFFGLSLQEGMRRDLQEVLARWGADVLFVATGEGLTTDVLDRLRAHPAIAELAIEGSTSVGIRPGDAFHITWLDVSWNHPRVVRLPLADGRFFDEAHGPVAVIGSEVKRVVFGEENPIGRRIEGVEIVGVLSEIPADDRVREKYNRLVLKPFPVSAQSEWGRHPDRAYLYVRASGSISGAERAIRSLIPNAATPSLMSQWYGGAFYHLRVLTRILLLSGLATTFVATLLAGGLLTLSTLRRRREIGIRLAVGAAGRDVLRQVVGEGTAIALVGTLAGMGLGAAAVAALEGDIHVSVWHALLPVGALALGFAAALAAGLGAARRSPVDSLGRRGLFGTRWAARWIGAFVVLAFAVATGAAVLAANLSAAASLHVASLWGDIDERTLLVEEPRESILASRDMGLEDAEAFEGLEGIETVVSYAVGNIRTKKLGQVVVMAPEAGYVDLRLFHITAGRDLVPADFEPDVRHCLLASGTAEQTGLGLGDEIVAGNARFEIVGTFAGGPPPSEIRYPVVFPQRYTGVLGYFIAAFLVRTTPEANVDTVCSSIRSAFSERYPGYAEVSVFSLNARAIELASFLRAANVRFAVAALMLLLLAVLEANAHGRFILNQRTSELGVRRSIGASPLRIALGAWRESTLLAALGASLGAVVAHFTLGGVLDWFPGLERPPVVVTLASAAVTLFLIAALGALPVRSVMVATPSDLLRKGRL
jgi:ABC-type antimicrobial peptide transport system permease subunit